MSTSVTLADRERLAGHPALCVWLTGLPAAGKTTLARAVERRLFERGLRTSVLDGDELRTGINAGLGFTPSDRSENLRRAGHAARLIADSGAIVLCAFVSPAAADRARARSLFAPGRFVEVWVRCPIEVCRARDPKGLYAKAARGELSDLTGVGAPYEAPLEAEIIIDAAEGPLEDAVARLEADLVARLEALAGRAFPIGGRTTAAP
jgi:adenylyl-sulfate kinase